MKYLLPLLLCLPAPSWGQRFQLAAPRIIADSVFFRQKAQLSLEFDLEGAKINYTTTGGLPSDSTPVYEKPFVMTASGAVRARAAHPDFIPSRMEELELVQVLHSPDSLSLRTAPDTLYAGKKGGATLFDLQKAGRDLKDGRWLGFRGDTVVIEVFFKQGVECKRVIVSHLLDPGAWIFPPKRIEVLGASGAKGWLPMGVWTARPKTAWEARQARYDFYQRVVLRPAKAERLQIRIIPFGPLPDGHPGAGKPAWLFLDEIVFQ